MVATSVEGEVASYLALFVLTMLSGAGVPMIGTAAVTAAAILASQGTLSLEAVIAVACAGSVIGGLLGYGGGRRWGLAFMERPGRFEEQRINALEQGHTLYERWGWLACFFIPSFVAGIARMRFLLFAIFKSFALVIYQFATALAAYGASKVVSGHTNTESIAGLAVGVVLIVIGIWRLILPRRWRAAERAADGADADAPNASERRPPRRRGLARRG